MTEATLRNMDYKAIYYPESKYGGFTDVDGTIVFYSRVNSLINNSSVVLDVGCGRGQYGDDTVYIRRGLRVLKGKCAKVIGVDVDPAAAANQFIDEFHLLTDTRFPLSDGSVDLCVCDNVLEHVQNPDSFYAECKRVLKPGGYLCIRTPNVISYVGLASRLIPNRHHSSVVCKVQERRKEEDVFPTLYRCNTIRAVRRMMDKYGFDHCVYGYDAEPSYLSFSRLFYFLGALHERYAPRCLKTAIFAFAQKKR